MSELRLFVWTEFYPDYTTCSAFAIAKNEAEAKTLVEYETEFEIHNWGILTVYPLSRKIARLVSGSG
ncbi:hypothetical protein [Flavobacterium sp.]|uniref:hypothetical protein n=1 Tax=Flavobacterium sp. TaxID=239 RepID=UPI002B4B78BA|nr:hypothetical protein [Flavobacterium sp.]HLF51525.1 hypothetical protein [Flavobacterium sp.]